MIIKSVEKVIYKQGFIARIKVLSRLTDTDAGCCRVQSALPLSAVLFRGGKHVQPQCPPRLDLQVVKMHQWSRAPMNSNKVHVLKLSDIRGWSMLCEDAGETRPAV